MSDYILCARDVKRGRFGDEPGATRFLKVPGRARGIRPGHEIKRSDWFREVLAEAGACGGDILVFVHGYNNDQEIVLKRHRMLKESLRAAGYAGVVASFDWPSADRALNYLEDRSDAKQTAIRLVADCIAPFSVIQSAECRVNVHVLAHSTGAYVVREAFDDADDRPRIASANWTASQVVFIAADVSAKSMGAGHAKSSSLYRHCVRLTNYSNPFDAVLKLSNVKRVGVAPRAGRVGLPEVVPDKAVNVDCGRYYAANEERIGDGLGAKSHSWYFGDPVFTKDLLHTLEGDIDRRAIPTRVAGPGGELWLA
jgi:esterase/lipase superfamily enzyme